jgi:DNA-binding transcriptional regulator PaaX
MSIVTELLLTFIDAPVTFLEAFDPRGSYRKPINEYRSWRKNNSDKGPTRLITNGYIKNDNQGYYVVTSKGTRTISSYLERNLIIEKPTAWDQKWRIVIFDIPEEKKIIRDRFRRRLLSMDFVMIQKSVFCHSAECLKEIVFLTKLYQIEPYITYLEATNIVSGKNIFEIFKNKGYLK